MYVVVKLEKDAVEKLISKRDDKALTRGRKTKYPWAQMTKPYMAFFVPNGNLKNLTVLAYLTGKKYNRKFKVVQTEENGTKGAEVVRMA